MPSFKPLIRNQSIKIDSHHPNEPVDWYKDDIHLHKKMNEKVKGKIVEHSITLNQKVKNPDHHIKKNQKRDAEWMRQYNNVKKEVRKVLEKDKKKKAEFVETLRQSLSTINKELLNQESKDLSAIEQALMNIAAFWGLNNENLLNHGNIEHKRGFVCLFKDNDVKYYIGYGKSTLYLGEGDGLTFSRRVGMIQRQ